MEKIYFNFPDDHGNTILWKVVTEIILYKDSYSAGLEWESNLVRKIYGRMDLFCLSSSSSRCKLHIFERVSVVMIICKNSARSSCVIRRSGNSI
jgi:hypothetical protein